MSLAMLEKCHQPMFRLQKGLEGPSHVSPGIPGRVESLCWLLALNDQEDTFLSKKSSVTSVISRDQRRSNTSCFLACCLVDFFFDEHYSFSDFLSKLCRFARETCQKGH